MFATLDDLEMSSKNAGQIQQERSAAPLSQNANHNPAISKKASSKLAASYSSDEIQVIDDQQPAIPIRPSIEPGRSNCYSDLDVGSVHACRRQPSPLCLRHKQDDLELLRDSLDSSPCERGGIEALLAEARGRGRGTKRLLHPQPGEFGRRGQCYPHTGFRLADHDRCPGRADRHEQPGLQGDNGRPARCQPCWLDNGRGCDDRSDFARRGFATKRPLLPPNPFGLEHEAVVFDNFEESGPSTPASDSDIDAKDPFDTHLRFVRPVLPICANPGAFVALDATDAAGGYSDEPKEDRGSKDFCNKSEKIHRVRHYRAVSELMSGPTLPVSAMDARATRRRATIGSEVSHAHRLPTLSRRGDMSA